MVKRTDRTWVEISGRALRRNLHRLQQLVGPSVAIMPVIKANAYGHGVDVVVQALRGIRHWGYGLAYGREALLLRQHGYAGRLLVLSYWQADELPRLIKNKVEVVVWDESSLQQVLSLPRAVRQRAKIHLKIDSGTSRIGFLPNQLSRLAKRLASQGIQPVAVFSHLAHAEESGHQRTREQIKCFTTLVSRLGRPQGRGVHLACTAAALRYPGARFGLIRPGIGLYGLWPSPATMTETQAKNRQFHLEPVLQWKSRLSQVKSLPAGVGIGYGSTVVTNRPIKLGIIPVGYADGYDRRLSNRSWVMIRGRRVPVVGRICMNLMMVEVTKIPRVRVGDEVVLLGPGITADRLASMAQTIQYEITTRIHGAIPRVLV